MIWECVIIGAGASGLYAAAQLDMPRVLILEKKNNAGLKLGVSGSGQCNLTHEGYARDFFDHYGEQKSFVKHALKMHDGKAVRSFFSMLGVATVVREDGKVFPADYRAQTVIAALLKRICALEHNVRYGERVITVGRYANGYQIKTEGNTYLTKRLIIATGGKSYPSLGSEGDGYAIAASLGLPVTALAPGLTGILCADKALTALSGIGFSEAQITNRASNKKYTGDLLITHVGLSGPVIINNSRDFKAGDRLTVSWLGCHAGDVMAKLQLLIETNGAQGLRFLLNQFALPERLKLLIAERIQVDERRRLAELSRETRLQLFELMTAYPIEIKSLQGFDTAMVTVGGIATTAISAKTMAADAMRDLYAIGEVLDVDGDTGGYNLQWAFSSAYAAAQTILSAL